MRSHRFFAGLGLLGALLVSTMAGAEAPNAESALAIDRKLMATGDTGSEIMANLTYLSDMIGPRLTGSANLKRANDWAAEKMKSYGLANVNLEAWELPMAWERGTATARIVEPENGIALTVAAMGWTPGTQGKVAADVVVVKARNLEELKAYEGKLKGAIVMRGAPTTVRPITDLSNPMERPGAPAEKGGRPERPAGFNNRAESQRMRREMADFLRKEGAAVLLMDSAKPHGLMNMTGSWAGRDRVTAQEPLPALFVAHEHYELLYRLVSREAPARTRLEVEITNKIIPGPLPVYNTVGEIRGSEKPDEFVIVGAHLDSWDLGQGTTDNGTGSCVVLETARLLANSGIQPRRTIRFVLFTGEEQGLHGSKAYVQKHKDELPRISAALVHDTGTGRVTEVTLQGHDTIKPLMEAELTTLKELGVNEISTRSMSGSDHQSFDNAGVPGFMFRQDPAEYRLTHHSQSDTLDKARAPDLIQGAKVMAILAARLANRNDMLPRDKKAEEKKKE